MITAFLPDCKEKTPGSIWGNICAKEATIGISWKQPVILVLVAAVFCVSFAAPSPAKEKAQQRHLVAQQAKEEEEKIEKVSEELAENWKMKI